MARVVGFCKVGVQILVLLSSLQFVLRNRNYSDYLLKQYSDSSDILVKQAYSYISYTQVEKVKGFKLLELNGGDRRSDTQHNRVKGASRGDTILCIFNSSRYSLLTKFLLVTLISCGDIHSNPGPINNQNIVKRKYNIKFPCSECQRGIRNRKVNCVRCGSITHVRCIASLTNELYDDFANNGEEIIYTCKFCTTTNNLSHGDINDQLPIHGHVGVGSNKTATVGDGSIKTATVGMGLIKTVNENFTQGENSAILNTTNNVTQSNTFTQEENDNIEHPSSIENDASQDFQNICEFCRCNIKVKNKNIQCNTCLSSFHPRCYRKASFDNSHCNICLAQAMPFYMCDLIQETDIGNETTQTLIYPSQTQDNMFDCFKEKGLHFIHINARSMFHKLPELVYIANKSKAAIISITETWLDSSFPNDSIKIEGYNILRRDRQTHAGGVCMYVRSDLAYNPREDLQNENLEDLWLELLLPKTKPIVIGTCYRAPNNSKLTESLENTVSRLRADCDAIILGDFNYCLIKNKTNKMTKVLDNSGFIQLIDTATRVTKNSSSLIDHIYTNETRKISQSGVIESGISDHFITFCTRKILRGQIGKHNTIKIRPMKNYSKEIFVDLLKGYDWNLVCQVKDNVNEAWEKFSTMFTQVLDDIAPEKEIRIKGRTEPWIDAEIIELMQERDRALFNANRNKSDSELRKRYNRLRNKVIKQTRKTKSKHFCEKIEENKENPKLLWRQLNSIGYSNKSKEKSKIVLEIDGEKCFDPIKLANNMGEYFLTVAEKLKSKIPNLPKVFDTRSQKFNDYYSSKGIVPKSKKNISSTRGVCL